ncbi:MAG: SDR family NAD(P)-dependent oxidoreductase [Chitinophagales bacterium]
MENKSLIITGADGALGRVVVEKLLAEGWRLHASVVSEKNEAKLKELFPSEIDKTIFPVLADLSDENAVKKIVLAAKDVFGLVHIAGGYKEGKSIADYTLPDFDFLMQLNVKPTFLLLKEIVPLLKIKNGGAIVTIGAKSAIHPMKGNAVYAASKSAVVAMTLNVAEECREFNIRANTILPDTLQTPNNLSWATEEQFKKFTPLADIADLISFLVSEKGKGVTGMMLPMFGKKHT